jgi:hypothetical protein
MSLPYLTNYLLKEVSEAIMKAEFLETQATEAWKEVARLEKELTETQDQGPDRDLSIRGRAYAQFKVQLLHKVKPQ